MINYPIIDPVALSLGPLKVHWYGLTYLGGLLFAWWLAGRRAQRADSPIDRAQVDDLIFLFCRRYYCGGGVSVMFCFMAWTAGSTTPCGCFAFGRAEWLFMAAYWGLLQRFGCLVAVITLRFAGVADFVAPLTPVGLALGRLGNFIGQELWGRPTDVPWAMIFPRDPLALARHPSQLYQFALEGCLLFFIVWIFSLRPRPQWSVAGVFLVGYGILRFIAEFFREPDAHLGFQAFGWLTRGQLLCLPMLLLGLWLLHYAYRSRQQ